MNAVPLDPGLLLQFFESLLWAFVWAVVVLFGVELVCVAALWVLDVKQGSAHPAYPPWSSKEGFGAELWAHGEHPERG